MRLPDRLVRLLEGVAISTVTATSSDFTTQSDPEPAGATLVVCDHPSCDGSRDDPLGVDDLEPAWKRRTFLLLALALTIGFFLVTQCFWAPAHVGVDQNGYLVGGKMFADHGSMGFTPPDAYSFVGRMWIADPDGKTFYPKYPLGLPLLYAIMLWAGGIWAFFIGGTDHGAAWAFLISPVCMALGVLATYRLLRLAMRSTPAFLGTLAVATSPVTLELANNPNSHAASLCAVAWGMFLLIRWWQIGGTARAAGAGFLLGYAVTIRYTEGLLILPLLAVAAMNLRWRVRKSWLQTGVLLGAWALPVAVLVGLNLHWFGDFTGYDSTNESTGFSYAYFLRNWEVMLRQMQQLGLLFVLPLSVFGLIIMLFWRWRMGLVMALWIVPGIVVYTAYYWAPDGMRIGYMRFFTTILPALALCAMWMVDRLTALAAPPGRRLGVTAGLGVVIAIASGVQANYAIADLENEYRQSLAASVAGQRLVEAIPSGSLLFGDQRSLNYLQFVGDWRLYTTEPFTRASIQRLNRLDPDDPQGLQPRRAQNLYEMLKDYTDAQLLAIHDSIVNTALNDGRRVFFLLPERSARATRQRYFPPNRYAAAVVDSWDESQLTTVDEPPTAKSTRDRGRGQPFFRLPSRYSAGGSWQLYELTSNPKP